jgi:superfamily II RNA helicase
MNLACLKAGHQGELIRCVCINKTCREKFICAICFHDLSSEHNHGTKDIIYFPKFVEKAETAYQKLLQDEKGLVNYEEGEKIVNMLKIFNERSVKLLHDAFKSLGIGVFFYASKRWFPSVLTDLKTSADIVDRKKCFELILDQLDTNFQMKPDESIIEKMKLRANANDLPSFLDNTFNNIEKAIRNSIEQQRLQPSEANNLNSKNVVDLSSNLGVNDTFAKKVHRTRISQTADPKHKSQISKNSKQQYKKISEGKSPIEEDPLYEYHIKKKVASDKSLSNQSSITKSRITFNFGDDDQSTLNLHQKSTESAQNFKKALTLSDCYLPLVLKKKDI